MHTTPLPDIPCYQALLTSAMPSSSMAFHTGVPLVARLACSTTVVVAVVTSVVYPVHLCCYLRTPIHALYLAPVSGPTQYALLHTPMRCSVFATLVESLALPWYVVLIAPTLALLVNQCSATLFIADLRCSWHGLHPTRTEHHAACAHRERTTLARFMFALLLN